MKKEETIVREGRAYGANRANRANGADRAYWAYGLIIGLIGLMGLMGCSKDEASVKAPGASTEVEVASFVTLIDEADGANRAYGAYGANKTNRAWTIPSGFVAYEDGVQPIGIAFTQNNHEPMIGSFFKSSDKWRTDLDIIASADYYYLYGYIPHQTAINYSITGYDGTNGAYSDGAIMTLQKVPTVMPNDLCVVIGAKHGYDREHDGNNDGTNRLRKGDFSFRAKAGTDQKDYVFLLFDHLYAALRVRMRVHDDYAALRTIKLKSLQLDTQAGEQKTTKKTTIEIKLKANDGSASPIEEEELTFTPTGEAIDGGLEFWSSTYGEQLTTDFKPFIGHFMPSGITKLILTSTYDVYDRNNKNLIRQNCKVTNSVLLSELFTGQSETERGKRYTINMTIQPTYLYMLSEPDLDNPTVVVN